MKIGLFGGTFDPIHLGHVDMIRQLCSHVALEKVIFIPSYIPPLKHKAHMTSYEDRLMMTRLALKEEPKFEVSTFESESNLPSYTINTVAHFKEKYPVDQLFYIMGVDAFNDIERWYHWQELLHATNIIIVDRPQKSLKISETVLQVLHSSPYEIYHMPLHTLPISSTMVRQSLVRQERVDEFLPNEVLEYILDKHLYQLVDE